MGLLDRWFGGSSRRQRAYEAQQLAMQQELISLQKEQAERARRDAARAMQENANELAADNKDLKARQLNDAVMRLGGSTGFRSLLSGRKGGGGFGPRGLLDAA